MSPGETRTGPPLARGFRVGHWTDPSGRTGCAVVLPPPGNVASCAVRGSSPSTRELEHLDPARKLTEIHGVLLTGGSAFGLAAAQGVVEWLEERGIGYRTPLTPIPIVPAAVIFDASAADKDVRPGAAAGRATCEAASEGPVPVGPVGVGAGATVGKWAGLEFRVRGGVGTAGAQDGELSVAALAVVNAVGDVVDDEGRVVAGTTSPDPSYAPPPPRERDLPANTVLAIATTNASIDKRQAGWLAERASDGITVSVRPAHTRYDGDVAFFLAGPASEDADGTLDAVGLDVLGFLATRAVADAVRNAVEQT